MRLPEIKGFLESSFIDWPGRLTASIWLAGCNLRCPFCHNRDLVLSPETFPNWPLKEVLRRLRKNRLFVESVCISGGEPTIHPGLADLLEIFKNEGLAVKLDTNGTQPQVLRELILKGLVDFVAMDVKAPLESRLYRRITGKNIDISNIKESISIILETGVEHLFRMTVVPGFHSPEVVFAWVQDLQGAQRLTLQNFSPHRCLDKTLESLRPFDEKEFSALCALVEENHLITSESERARSSTIATSFT